MNLREQILAVNDLPLLSVKVPEWKATVHFRVLNGLEREQALREWDPKDDRTRAKLLVRVLCDDKGQQLFTAADIEAVSKKSGIVLTRLFDQALEHNQIGTQANEDAKKNSSQVPPANS